MTREELELMDLECRRDLALAIAESMIKDPTLLYAGNSTPEQQSAYYHACVEAAEHYDELLAENLSPKN